MAFNKQHQLDLLDRYRTNPTTQLRNQIVIVNQGLVQKVAHRFVKQLNCVDLDDLFQVGVIGLIKSIDQYDPKLNTSFASYAIPFIRGQILHYLRDKNDTIKKGRNLTDFIVPSKKAVEKLRIELGRNPTDLEIATELGVDLKKWLEIQQGLFECNLKSLNYIFSINGETPIEIVDIVVDKTQSDRAELTEILDDLRSAIEQLDSPEKSAIESYYLDGLSRKDTGKKVGVGPMTITRRLAKGVQKLRALLLDTKSIRDGW